ncbi:MarR family winged helix-turn-helix transcriptional regulator [Devosia ginsengisoli]|uniref:MarR family transcriptional regulator n=1 Tax=Devosia ginsengisoli TaxID=400770 RepID=A0A5B8LNP4_9HYPH|nr:MarR family transcriptional regulator [Devosia ginsengisoli]QDZ09937.1 MarR family transcriptional regulator [Devosia ginsengisoli]
MNSPSSARNDAARQAWRLMFDILMQTNAGRQESLGRRNLTPNDSRALYTLDRDEGKAIGALARQWGCDPSTATWVVDRLEKAGLAERRPSPTDRRVKLVALTAQGATTMHDLLAEFHEPPDMLNNLTAAELETFQALLAKLTKTPADNSFE